MGEHFNSHFDLNLFEHISLCLMLLHFSLSPGMLIDIPLRASESILTLWFGFCPAFLYTLPAPPRIDFLMPRWLLGRILTLLRIACDVYFEASMLSICSENRTSLVNPSFLAIFSLILASTEPSWALSFLRASSCLTVACNYDSLRCSFSRFFSNFLVTCSFSRCSWLLADASCV